MLTFGGHFVPSVFGHKYFLTIVDDRSRFTWVYLMTLKSEARVLLQNFIKLVQVQFNRHVKIVRSDNGKEFSMEIYFSKNGMIHQTSCPETPQQNAVVERKHQHILNIARSLIFQSNLPLCFWNFAIAHAVFLMNRTPNINLKGYSPYQILHNKLPYLNHLKVFGSLCYATSLMAHRRKFDSRARQCIFLGFKKGTKCYILFYLTTKEIL